MRAVLLILFSCTGLFATWGVPAADGARSHDHAAGTCPVSPGVVIETDVQSSVLCRLIVTADEDTRSDRGFTGALGEKRTFTGSFRFWSEPVGRVLYVYDETQSLVARVVNPCSVTVAQVFRGPSVP